MTPRWEYSADIDWRNWTVGVEWGQGIRVLCLGPVLLTACVTVDGDAA